MSSSSKPIPTPASRTVKCYHCRKAFDVPAKAMSISCPWCYKRVALDNHTISGTCWTSRVQTCGKIIIKPKSQLVASHIEAAEGIEVHGALEGTIISWGPVWIGPKATVKGTVKAPAIHVEKGGAIDGGFVIHTDKIVRGPSRPPVGLSPTLIEETPLERLMQAMRARLGLE